MGKKKDKKDKVSKGDFGRAVSSKFYGPGKDVRDQLDRYGVEGARYSRADMQGYELTKNRTVDDVKADLSEAMMNDYDTRRGLEAAAMAGNEDALKYAENGIRAKAKDLVGAYDVMKALKKEHVGGGGMRGAKNEAGLTQALVQHERDVFNKSIDERIAANKPAPVDSVENTVEPEQPSQTLEQSQNLADVYKQDVINNYIDDYNPMPC